MTLRTRLTVAFLAVVLGPVLIGAVAVGTTVAAVNRARALERLDLAAGAVQTAVDALCQRLSAAAEVAAALPTEEDMQSLVNQDLADGVRVVSGTGDTVLATPGGPGQPWADCANPVVGEVYQAVAARVAIRGADGGTVGYAYAAQTLTAGLLGRLAAAGGASVTLLAGENPLSTERGDRARAISRTAGRLSGSAVGHTFSDRYVRRLAVVPGQPLELAVSVAGPGLSGLYLALIGIVMLAAALAVLVAWWLARTTTRPLAELATAATRVADGDLSARVPVRARDEVGVLGDTFNRMTREMQAYVEALTASRDQLRGHLGLLGDTLSSTHDLARILQVILRTALAATGAQAGVVLLADPTEAVLVGQCAQGLAERGAPEWPLRLPLGTGLLGSVAASGEARLGSLRAPGGRRVSTVDGEPCGQTYMAVPFGSGRSSTVDSGELLRPEVQGVLALYDRVGHDEFDDADLVTLRTFAAQAAVAVENVRSHEEAQRLSHTDPLTGLYNYRTLRDSLRREVERANRFGHRLCVLALDLDRFKEVNDSYGHAAGDAVLAEFSRRLGAEIREVDLAFRQGGEEFVVILPETDAIGGITVADRLGVAIRSDAMAITARRSGNAQPLRIPVTVSIGIGLFPDHGTTGAAVLEAADDALYAAKRAGRDTYRLAPSVEPGDPEPAVTTVVVRNVPTAETGGSGGPHPPLQTRGR